MNYNCNKKYSFKFVSITLILLIVLQGCGSSATLFVNPSQTLDEIAQLEAEASKMGKRVILKSGDISAVSSLYKVTPDSVFFQKNSNHIIGYSQDEINSYNITARNTKSHFGFVGLMGVAGILAAVVVAINNIDYSDDAPAGDENILYPFIGLALVGLVFSSFTNFFVGQSKSSFHKIKFTAKDSGPSLHIVVEKNIDEKH